MWEAIFADVGVALIAIANAIRVQKKFSGERFTLSSFFGSGNNNKVESNDPESCCEVC